MDTPKLDIDLTAKWLTLLHGRTEGPNWIVLGVADDKLSRPGCGPRDKTFAYKAFDYDTQFDAALRYVKEVHEEGWPGIYLRITGLAEKPAARGTGEDSAWLPALMEDIDIAGAGHALSREFAQRVADAVAAGKTPPLPLPSTIEEARRIVTESGLPDPTLWIHSGGGLYPIWIIEPVLAIKDTLVVEKFMQRWHRVLLRTARRQGVHLGAEGQDITRILRVPGTLNRKPEAGVVRACRIVSEDGMHYSPDELMAALSRAEAELGPDTELLEAQERIRAARANPAGAGKPGYDYDASHSDAATVFTELLEPRGWKVRPGRSTYEGHNHWLLVKPGKDVRSGQSATLCDGGVCNLKGGGAGGAGFKVFADSAFPPPLIDGMGREGAYRPSQLFTILNYGDLSDSSFSAAMSQLAGMGYGAGVGGRDAVGDDGVSDESDDADASDCERVGDVDAEFSDEDVTEFLASSGKREVAEGEDVMPPVGGATGARVKREADVDGGLWASKLRESAARGVKARADRRAVVLAEATESLGVSQRGKSEKLRKLTHELARKRFPEKEVCAALLNGANRCGLTFGVDGPSAFLKIFTEAWASGMADTPIKDDEGSGADSSQKKGKPSTGGSRGGGGKKEPTKKQKMLTSSGLDEEVIACFTEDGELDHHKFSLYLMEKFPSALTNEGEIATYKDGVYGEDKIRMLSIFASVLERMNNPEIRNNVQAHIKGLLGARGLFLPETQEEPIVNFKNGMKDLRAEVNELLPHDPKYLSSAQLPIAYDPEAQCPTYLAWAEKCGIMSQLEGMEEAISVMLDRSKTPTKAVFTFGPSRSGKSTILRIVQAIAGRENTSSVSLKQLCDSGQRFMTARLYKKMLNSSGDLSAQHVEDISVFKMLTGEDAVDAERKGVDPFSFTNTALFMFSANNPPTVAESSSAYLNRIYPVNFPISFEGHEDPSIERKILENELPGVLNRLIAAWKRFDERGGYDKGDPTVVKKFEEISDRVRSWIGETGKIWTRREDGSPVVLGTICTQAFATSMKECFIGFNEFADENKSPRMGRNKFYEKMDAIEGVVRVRLPSGERAYNITLNPGESEITWLQRRYNPDAEPTS